MPYVLVHQQTADYARWRRVFDEAAPMRAAAGCTDALVLRDSADARKLTILFEFEDLEPARAYVASADLREAWERAAVEGETEIHLLTRVPDERVDNA